MHFALLWLALGVGAGTTLGFVWPHGLIVAIACCGVGFLFRPRISLLLLLGVMLGWGRVITLPFFVEPLPKVAENTTMTGRVFGNPEVRLDHQRVTFDHVEIEGIGEYSGKILVRAPLYPSFSAGDRAKLACHLEEPAPLGEFRYDMWLMRHHIGATCAFPQIQRVEHLPASGAITRLARFSAWVSNRINRALPEPEAGFARALVLGEQYAMSDEARKSFRQTGTSHIVALSGFNVTLILEFVQKFGKRLRIRFAHLAVISGGLITLFVVMTGAAASLVRASVMGLVVLFARGVGRRSRVPILLAGTGMAMVLLNPYVLLYDVGFELSFLATLGLCLLSEKCERALGRLPNTFLLRETLATTLAAMLFTAPLIAITFRNVSFVSPLANVLILPVIPFAMACVAVVAIVPYPVLAFPAYTVLHLVLASVSLLARIPGSSLTW